MNNKTTKDSGRRQNGGKRNGDLWIEDRGMGGGASAHLLADPHAIANMHVSSKELTIEV